MGIDFFCLKVVGTVLLSISLILCVVWLVYIYLEGRIFVFGGKFFDFHKSLNNTECIDCGGHLTEANQSQWHIYTKNKKGQECLANICLNCQEIQNRMWQYYSKDDKDDSFVLTGDEAEIKNKIKNEMIADGVWMNYDSLKRIEQTEIANASK